MAEHDPDAAEMLLQQLQVEEQAAAEEKLDPMDPVLHTAYDPLELYLRMAKVYGWTLSNIDEMDYVLFFHAVDKTRKILDEENRAYNNTQSGHIMTEAEMRAWLPAVRKYEGQTVTMK